VSRFLRSAVRSRLSYAVEQSQRFEAFHAANADLEIRAFVQLFTQDDVLTRVWEGLRLHLDLAASDWHAQAEGMTVAPLPSSAPAAMAFRFAVFRYAQRKKVDLRHFVSNHFPGEHLNARLMEWKRLFVHPFAADLRLLVERIERHLPQDEWVDLDAALAETLNTDIAQDGFGPRIWTDADDAAWEAAEAAKKAGQSAPAPVAPPASSADSSGAAAAEAVLQLGGALQALRQELSAEGYDAEAHHDLTLDLDALELELERPTFHSVRFAARLDALATRPAFGAKVQAVRDSVRTWENLR
jgi:hypothetical protein